jgi:hypothetical protein
MWRTSAGARGAAAATAAAGVACVGGGQVRTPTPTATLTRTTIVRIGADTADLTGGRTGIGRVLIGGAAGIGVEVVSPRLHDALIVRRSRPDANLSRGARRDSTQRADDFTENRRQSENTHSFFASDPNVLDSPGSNELRLI